MYCTVTHCSAALSIYSCSCQVYSSIGQYLTRNVWNHLSSWSNIQQSPFNKCKVPVPLFLYICSYFTHPETYDIYCVAAWLYNYAVCCSSCFEGEKLMLERANSLVSSLPEHHFFFFFFTSNTWLVKLESSPCAENQIEKAFIVYLRRVIFYKLCT